MKITSIQINLFFFKLEMLGKLLWDAEDCHKNGIWLGTFQNLPKLQLLHSFLGFWLWIYLHVLDHTQTKPWVPFLNIFEIFSQSLPYPSGKFCSQCFEFHWQHLQCTPNWDLQLMWKLKIEQWHPFLVYCNLPQGLMRGEHPHI